MLMVARAITRGLAIPKLLDLLAVEFLLCIGLYLDTSPVIPVYIAMLVGIRSGSFSLINLTVKRDSHRRYLAILYYFVFWVLLICAFNKGMVDTSFILFSIIVQIDTYFMNFKYLPWFHFCIPTGDLSVGSNINCSFVLIMLL